MCPHTTLLCVRILLLPVSSCCAYVRHHTTLTCTLRPHTTSTIRPHTISSLRPHTASSSRAHTTLLYVSSYDSYLCPHAAPYISICLFFVLPWVRTATSSTIFCIVFASPSLTFETSLKFFSRYFFDFLIFFDFFFTWAWGDRSSGSPPKSSSELSTAAVLAAST